MNKIVNGVANDYEFPFLEKTSENYYQVMNRYYTEEFVKQLQQELQRKDNIINELKEWIRNFTIDSDEWHKLIYDELGHYGIENTMILDKIKELEGDNK